MWEQVQQQQVQQSPDCPCYSCLAQTFHISFLKSFIQGALTERTLTPTSPAPTEIGIEPAYIVKEILNSQHIQSKVQYLIECEGYGPEERSRIPAHDLLDAMLCQG